MKIYNKFKELTNKYGIMSLLGSDGSCPCGHLELFGIRIDTHCWRTSYYYENKKICDCSYSGVHIRPRDEFITKKESKLIAKLFADYIKEAYYTEVNVKLEE